MKKKLCSILAAVLLLTAAAVPTAWGALGSLGNPIEPHGFPAFYQDAGGLALEPCLPPPAGNAVLRSDLCVFDALAGPPLQVGGESFWWSAEAQTTPLVAGGTALLVLALEAAFAEGDPADGQQMSFARLRIRIDVPTAGTYIVTHPFGTNVFENVTVADGINMTDDIGNINVLDPALGFQGALNGIVGPFLTWPGYAADPTLQGRATDPVSGLPTGPVLEQYVGNPAIPHIVTGGTIGNIFRIQGPGVDVQTNLFTVMGKVYDPTVAQTVHVFPNPPVPNLFAVGPVNRVGAVGPITPLQPEGIRTGVDNVPFPVGYPLWYQENSGTVAVPAGGVKITFCPPTDPMCISAPIETLDPNSVSLRIGEEGFWWSTEAQLPDLGGARLILALEAAFSGAGNPLPGNQIGFARLRIRINNPLPGTYTITHPYGTETLTSAAGERIFFSRDIMIINATDPDAAFIGALYGSIGPRFLKWNTFNPDRALNDTALTKLLDPNNPASAAILYVGDPSIPHAVTGGTNGNIFRIQGPGIDAQTNLFSVSGKVFDPATFLLASANAPVANPDAATLNLANSASITINVLANDTVTAPATFTSVAVLPASPTFGPNNGSVVVNGGNTVTYTPNAGFFGVDTFAYRVTDSAGLTSGNAIVTVTVVPVETITLTLAQLQLRRLQLDARGTSNFVGSTLTIRAGATAGGPVIGQALVDNAGTWRFRGTLRTNLTSISIINNATGTALLNQPVQVR